jgi:hypothetical protein
MSVVRKFANDILSLRGLGTSASCQIIFGSYIKPRGRHCTHTHVENVRTLSGPLVFGVKIRPKLEKMDDDLVVALFPDWAL